MSVNLEYNVLCDLVTATSATSGAKTTSRSTTVATKTTSAAATAIETASSTTTGTEAASGTTTAAETTSGTTTAAKTTTASARSTGTASLSLWLRRKVLWLGQESLQWKQLVRTNVELVAVLERRGLNALGWLDGEENFVQWTQDLVNLAHLCLVLQEDWCVEVWDLDVDGTTHNVTFTRMHEGAHLQNSLWGSLWCLRKPATAASEAASEAASTSVHFSMGFFFASAREIFPMR